MDGPAPSELVSPEPIYPRARALAVERAQLAVWLESLAASTETLLGSKRWRVGNLLGRISCWLRGLGDPPTAADDLRDVVARFRRWQTAAANWDQSPLPPSNETRSPSTDLIICVHNALAHVQACLASVVKHTAPPYRLILVDDGSDRETAAWLASFAATHRFAFLLRSDVATGYTRAANRGLAASTGEFVVLLNSDTVVTPHWFDHLFACAASDQQVGLVGPLSNAASWQSVPERFAAAGQWMANELPPGITPADVAAHLALIAPRHPRVPLLNGFCLLIKRAVLDAVGGFDETAFPLGYGEETDFCLRAAEAGFELALADNAYVYHAKSQSYGAQRRRQLVAQSNRTLRKRYGALRLKACEEWLKHEPTLAEARASVRAFLKQTEGSRRFAHASSATRDFSTPRILFVLPARPGGGGVHSIVQESLGMRRVEVTATVAIPQEYAGQYAEWYPQAAAQGLFIPFRKEPDVIAAAAECDVAIGTIYHSLDLVSRAIAAHPHVAPAYYVQDYEPWFFARYSAAWRAARRSYRQIRGCKLFAKTEWLCHLIRQEHGVEVQQVSPSLDHDLFHPAFHTFTAPTVRVTAMIRPSTPRRGAQRTVRTLAQLQRDLPALDIHVFGCRDDELDRLRRDVNLTCTQHGLLRREEVATLLRSCQVFLDLSDFQAFGRTALEAMASGCAVVVPQRGGAGEFARAGENALVVDTNQGPGLSAADYAAVRELASNRTLQARLRTAGIATAATYSVQRAVLSELEVLTSAVRRWRESTGSPVATELIVTANG